MNQKWLTPKGLPCPQRTQKKNLYCRMIRGVKVNGNLLGWIGGRALFRTVNFSEIARIIGIRDCDEFAEGDLRAFDPRFPGKSGTTVHGMSRTNRHSRINDSRRLWFGSGYAGVHT